MVEAHGPRDKRQRISAMRAETAWVLQRPRSARRRGRREAGCRRSTREGEGALRAGRRPRWWKLIPAPSPSRRLSPPPRARCRRWRQGSGGSRGRPRFSSSAAARGTSSMGSPHPSHLPLPQQRSLRSAWATRTAFRASWTRVTGATPPSMLLSPASRWPRASRCGRLRLGPVRRDRSRDDVA